MYLAMKSGAVIASGTLKKDPEVKTFDSGKTKASFSFIADKRKDESGRLESKWANCVAWDNIAKDAAALREGMTVLVTGRVQKRTWNDREFEDVNVDAIVLCGIPTRSVNDLKANFPNTVSETKPPFAEPDDDEEASLPF